MGLSDYTGHRSKSDDDGKKTDGDVKKKRVNKACDSCRMKKTKCDGRKPCTKCSQDNKLCTYSEKKKLQEKTYSSGYVELLECRIQILQKGVIKLVSKIADGEDISQYIPRNNELSINKVIDLLMSDEQDDEYEHDEDYGESHRELKKKAIATIHHTLETDEASFAVAAAASAATASGSGTTRNDEDDHIDEYSSSDGGNLFSPESSGRRESEGMLNTMNDLKLERYSDGNINAAGAARGAAPDREEDNGDIQEASASSFSSGSARNHIPDSPISSAGSSKELQFGWEDSGSISPSVLESTSPLTSSAPSPPHQQKQTGPTVNASNKRRDSASGHFSRVHKAGLQQHRRPSLTDSDSNLSNSPYSLTHHHHHRNTSDKQRIKSQLHQKQSQAAHAPKLLATAAVSPSAVADELDDPMALSQEQMLITLKSQDFYGFNNNTTNFQFGDANDDYWFGSMSGNAGPVDGFYNSVGF